MNASWYFSDSPSSDHWGPTVNGTGIWELGEQKTPDVLLGKPRTLDTYALVFLFDGRGRFRSGRDEYELESGMAFWVFPGQPHTYGADLGDRWNECWMLLSGEWMKRLEQKRILRRDASIWRVGLSAEAQAGFDELFGLCRANLPMLADKLASTAARIIFTLHMARLLPSLPNETLKMMAAARRFMEEHVESHVSIEQLADKFGISEVHFRRLFRQSFGQSVGQYMLNMKIRKAQQLMVRGLSIKEVSQRLNFANVYYFTRIFKKKTSLPPSQWLKSRAYTK